MPKRLLFGCLVLLSWFYCHVAQAGELSDRLTAFPNWQTKPPVQPAEGDLLYPEWFAGTWNVTSTLVDLVAPLAPEIVTPGFESNRQYLNQPIRFQVRFVSAPLAEKSMPFGQLPKRVVAARSAPEIVADRAFNGLNLARAYLANDSGDPVLSVTVDPSSPNRQVTVLTGNRQLVSIVTERATETPSIDQFITTELFQQIFRGISQPYLNQVETTTAYRRGTGETPAIVADQITAIYLSPQDPNYFKATGSGTNFLGERVLETLSEHPVALYRYRLEFSKVPHANAN